MDRVWIVEDSALAARVAVQALGDDFTCEVFVDGSSALERIGAGDLPGVLVLDWELPDISGIDICSAIRGRHDDLALPILLVTSRRDSAEIVTGLTAGANDYVPKPYVAAELLARVRSLARLNGLWRRTTDAEARLAATLRSIGDAVISTDADAQVVFMNGVAEQLTGWTLAEAVARPVWEVFRVVEDDADTAGRTLLVQRDRGTVPISNSAAPIRDERGTETGMVVVFRDVGDKRRAAQERERLHGELQLRSDFERQLIGIVSHDLRNPLSAILLSAEILLGHTQEARSQKVTQRIMNAAGRAQRMVNDLLDFTKGRLGGGMAITRAPLDLHALVRQIGDDLAASKPTRAIQTTTTGDGFGEWDGDRVAQALTNLVENALKYGAPDSPIQIRADGDPAGVSIAVHNTGAPIEPGALTRIFQPMQRATGRHEAGSRSVGLGLFIVEQIAHAHAGEVSVASTLEDGTTFTMRLPRA